ncbi:hypothetical protein QYM36_000368 [Artemia franciscana]|uniref:TRAF-type domain-containing protein n=1 Tax=Artemia franciscana TaxID=6661 RepID=A0AA88IFM0_ARTSF|nr:hypothetical protein QYM36_000368 [Artemia franciscana]
MGDSNKKQLTVDDVPDVFKTFRGENGSKITKKIHSPTAQAFSKSILPNQLRDKSHDLWLHPSVKFLSDSVGDASVLLTTQNSGSNEGHVEGYSIDTTESSDVIQEIQFPTEKLRDSTDQANLLRVVNTQETEAEATCGTTQVAFGNFALPNAPPKWFLEYMEADDRGEHSHTSIVCPHGCETTDLTEEDIETHIKESCPALTVNCSFKKVDCGFKGTQHIVEKHQKESTSHHLGLMCSFAERQQQELVKLQSQIEVQTKDKKDSGMFIRVAERIPLLNYACYVDGLREDQRVRLSNILKLKFNNFFGISNINYPGYQQQFVCVHEVHGIRALDFMSFLKKEYSAKIISYDNMYSYESPNSGPGYPSGIILPNGLAFWILEVDEI